MSTKICFWPTFDLFLTYFTNFQKATSDLFFAYFYFRRLTRQAKSSHFSLTLQQKESGKRSLAKVTKKVTEASEKVTKKWPKESRKREKWSNYFCGTLIPPTKFQWGSGILSVPLGTKSPHTVFFSFWGMIFGDYYRELYSMIFLLELITVM